MGLLTDFIHGQSATDEFTAARTLVHHHFPEVVTGLRGDLEDVARQKNISIRYASDIAFEGMIERDAYGRANITLRRGLNRRRERFTLAHELGHWLLQEAFLGTVEGKLFRGVSKNRLEMRDEERLASLLAAEILMPFQAVKQMFEKSRMLLSLINICRVFGVSRMAAVRRVADVCDQNLLLLQIVPFRFQDLNTAAEVDDAIFASARRATLFDRDRTRFIDRWSFLDLQSKPKQELQLRTPKGSISEVFEINVRSSPIKHAFALTSVDRWPNENGTRTLA